MSAENAFDATLELALRHALEYLHGLESAPVTPRADPATVRARLGKSLQADGLPPEQVLAELVRDSRDAIVGCAGGRFFGWVIGGSLPAALGADWMAAAWDQAAGLYASGPA